MQRLTSTGGRGLARQAARWAHAGARGGAAAVEELDFYQVLEVPPSASPAAIKAAFREKAKGCHPDAAGGDASRAAAFLHLVTAYRVLSSDRSRQLYDLSRGVGAPGAVRRAAASASAEADLEAEVDLSWGIAGALRRGRAAEGMTALDRVRAGLQDDLALALRRAFLGPPLEGLAAGRLPECFEADERSAPGATAAVLRVVSGRQLLGVAAQRTAAQLRGGGESAEALPGPAADPGAAALEPCGAAAPGSERSPPGVSPPAEPPGDDLVIDLILGGELVATAVRRGRPPPAWRELQPGVGAAPGPPPDAITFLGPDGRLLGRLHPPDADGSGAERGPSAARLLNAEGVHTHTVLRSTSPLVRHLAFIAEPATGVSPGLRPSKACVCRARRAWLPPSSLWPFKPQSWEHDIGGWYIEWGGDRQREHPAWLDPAFFVLTAALDTVATEDARRQPLGLFQRLRAGPQQEGFAGWLKSMLLFHGRGG